MWSATIKVTRTKRSSEEHSLDAWLRTSKDEGTMVFVLSVGL